MIKRFTKVNDNLYRGGAPSTDDVVKLKQNFGINKIVSLDEAAGNKIDRICKILNIDHIMIPIDVEKSSTLLPLLSIDLHDLLIKDGPTFVHCLQGKDRTGMLVAMFNCKYNNMPCDESIKEAKSFGFGFGLPAKTQRIYTKLIELCCQDKHQASLSHIKDKNNADIVENSRPNPDMKGSTLDRADMVSISPFLDPTSGYPEYRSDYEKTPIINVGPTANIGTGFVEV